MSKPSHTSKRRFRFQFNLLTFLLLVSAIGVAAGVWMSWIEPVRSQWAAVQSFVERGAEVETSPSKLPDWMKSFLASGQTENIETLSFTYKTLEPDDLKCLSRLRYLKRLNLYRCRTRRRRRDFDRRLPDH